jgi:phytoene dehydrogenase-like protein
VLALVRYTTYCDDPDRLSASAAIDQLRLSIQGDVLYIHDGWGALVAGLTRTASARGMAFLRAQRVAAVPIANGRAEGVTLSDGTHVPARAVIVATDPATAQQLIGSAASLPAPMAAVRVAALDVALRTLPNDKSVFAIALDEPWCFSADSVIARVAPDKGAVVHLAKYLPAGTSGTPDDEQQLERALDLLQPGWRPSVVHRRFLPTVTVSHALVTADGGGFAGRPSGRVPGVANVFLAGDWVGPVGQLADASVASGVSAARLAAKLVSEAAGGCGAR